jgi:hypothetical protein
MLNRPIFRRAIQSVPKVAPILTDSTFHFIPFSHIPTFGQQVDIYHKIKSPIIDIGFQSPSPSIGENLPSYIYHDYKRCNKSSPTIYRTALGINHLYTYLNDKTPTHYSFLTSVSPVFQKKVLNKSLDESKRELLEMTKMVGSSSMKKLYISCITDCSYNGPLDLDYIVHEILTYYTKYDFDEICLDDTVGNISFESFKYIIETICIFGVPKSKIGLRLRNCHKGELYYILRYALLNRLHRFDIGCDMPFQISPLPHSLFMT